MNSALFLIVSSVLSWQSPAWSISGTWATEYETPNGDIVSSRVVFDGKSGTYTVGNNVALLRDIRFVPRLPHTLGEATPSITGTWVLGQQSGYFVFREPDREGFIDGYWGYYQNGKYGPIVGSWDGIALVRPKEEPNREPLIPQPTRPNEVENNPRSLAGLPRAEIFVGNSKTAPASWLKDGAKLSDAVGKIQLTKNAKITITNAVGQQETVQRPATFPLGTCFLIAKGYGLTAKHVISGLDDPLGFEATFPAAEENRFSYFKLTSRPILIDPDIALLSLEPTDGAAWPNSFVSLTSALDPHRRLVPLVNRDAAAIHFPGTSNGIQQLSYKDTEFVSESAANLWYSCSTDAGSSGAPIFNSTWGLVAVHWGTDGKLNVGYKADFVLAKVIAHLNAQPDGQRILNAIGVTQ